MMTWLLDHLGVAFGGGKAERSVGPAAASKSQDETRDRTPAHNVSVAKSERAQRLLDQISPATATDDPDLKKQQDAYWRSQRSIREAERKAEQYDGSIGTA